jgi:alcohol dehydrogenase (cytochrome c)
VYSVLVAVTFLHLWTHVERGWMLGIPTVARGIVYEGTTRGDVLAIDEGNGKVLWRASLGANPDETYGNPRGVIASVAVNGDVAYAVSGSCEAGAFGASAGNVLWKRRICSTAKNDDTYSSPVVADGRVLFGIDIIADRPTDAGRLVALDAATGEPAWSFSPVRYRGTGGGVSATPAFDSRRGIALVGTGNPTPMNAPPAGADPYTDSVIAVDVRTGAWRWVNQLMAHDLNDFDVFASPRLFTLRRGGRDVAAVGVVQKDAHYFMLDELRGRILWQRALEPPMRWMQAIGTPAVCRGIIIVPIFHSPTQGELIALRAADGAILWRLHSNGIYGAPAIWRRFVLVAQTQGTLVAVSLGDGRIAGTLRLSSEFYGHGLAVDGDTLLVAGRGKFWAYRLEQ